MFNKSTIAVFCLMVLSAGPGFAGDLSLQSQGDNSGRQLAVLAPGAKGLRPIATVRTTAGPAPAIVTKYWPDNKIALPREMEEAADACSVVAGRLGRLAAGRLAQVATWFGALFNQLSGSPTATPVGAPYAASWSAGQPALYITPEGRLKTVVNR